MARHPDLRRITTLKPRHLTVALIALAACVAPQPSASAGDRDPRLVVIAPEADATVEQNLVSRGTAIDDGRITRVRIGIDGDRLRAAVCRCDRARVTWHVMLPELAFGRHELRIVATDDERRSTTVHRRFTLPEPAAPYRAFTSDSWWNTPFPIQAPAAASSHRWIRALTRETRGTPLALTGLPRSAPDQAQPVYVTNGDDPRFTIDPSQGPTVTVHIPRFAVASKADNPKMTIIDTASDQGVGLVNARFADGRWHARGLDRYYLSSEGIAATEGGTAGNGGHRGATVVLKALRLEEVLLAPVERRAQCFVPPRLIGTAHVWPMSGSDGDRRHGIPEGVVLRIKPAVNLRHEPLSHDERVVARMLQDYGCLISDGGAPRLATLRLSRAEWSATSLTEDSLSSIRWRDWEFVAGGYRP